MLLQDRYIIMNKLILLSIILAVVVSAPASDKMTAVPGYPANYSTNVYTGYLDVRNPNRSLHYVFVESVNGPNNKDPVTLWLNGGPGCSSLLGFIQQIGPYYLEDGIDYKVGDSLTENKYSWHKMSNLLFLESPAGVGYSINTEENYTHNDAKTSYDSLYALLNFFSSSKFPEYKDNVFFIAGESYAGKYIPDLAVLIDGQNQYGDGPKINLKAILVGNGIMSFSSLDFNTYQYIIDRSFVDPDISNVFQSSCKIDRESAGCRYFELEYQKGTEELNPYNVYGYCFYNDSFDATPSTQKKYLSQQSILRGIKKEFSKNSDFDGNIDFSKFNGAPCAFFDGIHDYFNLNEEAFKAKTPGMHWNGPCADNIKYSIDPAGSIHSYRYLLSLANITERKIPIFLYSGTWDSVVPYTDTLKGIKDLNLRESKPYAPWFTDKQHSGFEQLFSGALFTTFKGASHQVPQTKRAEAYQYFESIVHGHKYESLFESGTSGKKIESVEVI